MSDFADHFTWNITLLYTIATFMNINPDKILISEKQSIK